MFLLIDLSIQELVILDFLVLSCSVGIQVSFGGKCFFTEITCVSEEIRVMLRLNVVSGTTFHGMRKVFTY